MTKCWKQPKKRRTRRHHGKKKGESAYSGGDYNSKPARGHQWRVTREGWKVVPGSRRCAVCHMKPPGRGKPTSDKIWRPPDEDDRDRR